MTTALKKTRLVMFLLGLSCLPVCLPAHAEDAQPASVEPDNSQVNIRDRNAGEVTADQGTNQKSDREIMQSIRKSVMADKSLSTYAHNVKIIAVNGKVTLKGPVRSDAESKSIEDQATQVAGAGNVTNQLSVKAAR